MQDSVPGKLGTPIRMERTYGAEAPHFGMTSYRSRIPYQVSWTPKVHFEVANYPDRIQAQQGTSCRSRQWKGRSVAQFTCACFETATGNWTPAYTHLLSLSRQRSSSIPAAHFMGTLKEKGMRVCLRYHSLLISFWKPFGP